MGPFDTDGVTVDTCTACRAVWFDRGELARMLRTRDDLPSLDAMRDEAAGTSWPCPRCAGTSLVEVPYAQGAMKVATCATCQGVLSSLGDLRAMRDLAGARAPAAAGLAMTRAPASTLAPSASLDAVAARFADLERLSVKQRWHWFEALTGFEQPNQYAVIGNGMSSVFLVQEQTSGLGAALVRLLLGPLRPFTSHVEDLRRGTLALRLHRPFRWFLPELEVRDADEVVLARIARRWSWLHTRYEVLDASGAVIGEVHGPFLRPWTFELRVHGAVVATVQKRWSGFAQEALTDADNFEVRFAADIPPRWKPLALACAVMIDASHFERSKN